VASRDGSRRLRGLLLVSVSALAFGSAGVCAKAAMDGAGEQLSPMRLVEFRITAAAIVLQAIVAVVARRHRRRSETVRMRWSRRVVLIVLAYGLSAFAAVQSLYFLAIERMPVGVALLIEYLAPALVALWVVFVQHRPQPRATWIGIALTLSGLALIARPWSGFTLDGLGVTAALVAALALTAYFLIAESAGEHLPSLELCAWGATVGAIGLAVIEPWWGFPWRALTRNCELAGRSTPVWVLLAIVVLIGTVAAYLTGIAAMNYLPAPTVAVIATVEVVVASVGAWLLLEERLSTIEIIGGAVLLSGAVLAQRRSSSSRSVATIESSSALPATDGFITP
jgi:drug/metabolite transporter (DMT)-like permease